MNMSALTSQIDDEHIISKTQWNYGFIGQTKDQK